MTDPELDEKFRSEAIAVLPPAKLEALLAQCWQISQVDDVGALVQRFF